VIGAGVVGLTIAELPAAEGREVVLVDPGEPGMGASYGNAGTIADYATSPVGTPDVLWSCPSLLFDRKPRRWRSATALPVAGALAVRFALAIAAAPGGAQCPGDRGASVRGGRPCGRPGRPDRARASCSGAAACIFTRPRPGGRRQGRDGRRRALGVGRTDLGRPSWSELEPGLPPLAGAAFFTAGDLPGRSRPDDGAIAAQVLPGRRICAPGPSG
jgi:hypothetical protein